MALLELRGAPSRWRTVRLGDLLNVVRGASPRPKGDPRYFGGDIPWVLISDVTREASKFVSCTKESVTRAGAELSRLMPKGTLILTNSATVGVPKFLGVDACIHDGFVAFPDIPESLSADYLYEFFRALRPVILREIRQGVTQVNLNTDIVRDVRLPVPPLDEQRRIVAKLEALQARSRRAREALEAVPPLLEKLRQSILAAAFRGDLTKHWRAKHKNDEPASRLVERIRAERRKNWEETELAKMKAKGQTPTNEKWKAKYKEPAPVDSAGLPLLPDGWCWATVAEVAPLQPGFAFPSTGFRKSGVRLLKGVNVRDGWIATDELDHWDVEDCAPYSAFRLRAGDIVLAMDRPVYSSGSRATKVVRLDDAWEGSLLLQRVGRFQRVESLRADYLLLFLQSFRFREHLVREQNGTQDGKDLPHVSAGVVDAALIPIPPAAEQAVIAERATPMLAALQTAGATASNMRDQLDTLERAVLAKAFRGELTAQNPNGEAVETMVAPGPGHTISGTTAVGEAERRRQRSTRRLAEEVT